MSGAESTESRVLYQEDAGLGLITLAASEQGNRLNADRLKALRESLERGEASPAVRAIVLRSNGPRFCLGMDFSFFLELGSDQELAGEAVRDYAELLARVRALPKPVFALVDGEVRAGGLGLLAAADIVFASSRSEFQLSEVLLGLIPANVLPFLIERIGARRAAWLTLGAGTIGAERAREIGLVDEVYPPESLEKETRSYFRTLMRSAPHALTETKAFIAKLAGLGREEAIELAGESLLRLAAREDVHEAISAFEEGGLPAWSQRFKPQNKLWIGESPDE